MSQHIYTTRAEAIQREIIKPLEACGFDTEDIARIWDIDKIAELAIDSYNPQITIGTVRGQGNPVYYRKGTAEEFWTIVSACEVAA